MYSLFVNSIFFTALAILGPQTVIGQSVVECYSPGECLDSQFLTAVPADSFNDCLAECQTCFLYENCDLLDSTDCDDCISGNTDCETVPCFIEGVSCRGTDIDNEVGVGSAEECLDLCEVEDGCSYATYFGDSGACVLLEDCTDLETCDDCTTSGVQACGDGGNGEQSGMVLLTIGGYNGGNVDTVETTDLFGDSGDCTLQQTPLPFANEFSVAMTMPDGRPLNCGGYTLDDYRDCYVYNKDDNEWTRDGAPTMLTQRRVGSQVVKLTDGTGRHKIRSTEFFTLDGEFVPGPDLPYNDEYGCSVELSPGIVFVAGGEREPNRAFLIDVNTEESTELPNMPTFRERQSCGVTYTNTRGGADIVVAGDIGENTVDIYNTATGFWRPGPFIPADAGRWGTGSLPYEDSFILIGGNGDSGFSTKIYKYLGEEEEWELLDMELLNEKYHFGHVYVDKSVVNCA